jgi:hypothetical protein
MSFSLRQAPERCDDAPHVQDANSTTTKHKFGCLYSYSYRLNFEKIRPGLGPHLAEMILSESLFNVPNGAVALVYIIDTTFRLSNVNTTDLMVPALAGFERIPTLTTWSFLIESSTGKKAVFDLGVPPDINTYAQPLTEALKSTGWIIEADRNVVEILQENGVEADEIDSVIWRYEASTEIIADQLDADRRLAVIIVITTGIILAT